MNTKITLIVAAAENNAIGKDNQMPWHLPNDFKYFKNTTLEHSVVMGRKTFDSIGKPLPERRNIILTRDQNYTSPDVDVANSVDDVLTYCRDEREIFVIGGANVYKQFISLAQKVHLTRVHTVIDGDAFFPELSENEWQLTSSKHHQKDGKHAFDYSFEVWERR
ncbi:dihydrofolate reductase [Sphingobacterium sp. SGG-5]|uniref:dihydrofolate reductase n=1 Tax=Sphingobacterium sp. SGG-5 TaxID=2710881 RepID=UPI0019D25CC2|nr:dihydrofolate reductase [Sphingobacterium sp. SGG-5]